MILSVDKNIVLKFLGYGKKKAPKIIEKKIDQELEKYNDYIEPEYYIKKISIDTKQPETVVLDENITLKSSYLYKKLWEMKSAYAVLYTVGEKIEQVIEEYSNNSDMMRAMIVDKIGVVALDNLRDYLANSIEEKENPLFISSVSYPAQGDFNVEAQSELYKLFKKDTGNITINQFSQFSPIKTVLLVYGIGDKKNSTKMCDECENPCSSANFTEN